MSALFRPPVVPIRRRPVRLGAFTAVGPRRARLEDVIAQIDRFRRESEAWIAALEFADENPDSYLAWMRLAFKRHRAGDREGCLDAAAQMVRCSATLSPEFHSAARMARARLLQQWGEGDAAIAELRAVVQTCPPESLHYAYLSLGDALERRGDTRNAERARRQAARWTA